MEITSAFDLTRKILDEQGFPHWGIMIEEHQRELGVCRYEQHYIALQSSMVCRARSFADILPIVLHEVAHIFCPGDGHGKRFHAKLRELIAYYVFGNS